MTLSAYSAAKSMETSVGLKARCDLAAAKAGLPFGWINDHWRSFWSRDDWSAAWTTAAAQPVDQNLNPDLGARDSVITDAMVTAAVAEVAEQYPDANGPAVLQQIADLQAEVAQLKLNQSATDSETPA